MRELLTFVAQSLVDHPDQVVVRETEGPEAVILELSVAEAGTHREGHPHGGLRCDCQEQQACFCRNSQAGRRRSSELNVGVGAVMFPRLF